MYCLVSRIEKQSSNDKYVSLWRRNSHSSTLQPSLLLSSLSSFVRRSDGGWLSSSCLSQAHLLHFWFYSSSAMHTQLSLGKSRDKARCIANFDLKFDPVLLLLLLLLPPSHSVYCSGILIALFTSSCYWYSGSPTSEEYYGLNPADLSSPANPTAALRGGPVDQARSHLANLHAARVTNSAISSDSSVKVEGGAISQGSRVGGENQDQIIFPPLMAAAQPQIESSIPSISKRNKQDNYRPNWCWLDLRGTGTGTGWWEPLQRPGCESRRMAAAAVKSRNMNRSKDTSFFKIQSRIWDFFFTPTFRLFSFFPLLQKLHLSLPRLPPRVFVGIPNSGIGVYLNLSLGFWFRFEDSVLFGCQARESHRTHFSLTSSCSFLYYRPTLNPLSNLRLGFKTALLCHQVRSINQGDMRSGIKGKRQQIHAYSRSLASPAARTRSISVAPHWSMRLRFSTFEPIIER